MMPHGAQGYVSGNCGRPVLFPGPTILADRHNRSGLAVDDGTHDRGGCHRRRALPGKGSHANRERGGARVKTHIVALLIDQEWGIGQGVACAAMRKKAKGPPDATFRPGCIAQGHGDGHGHRTTTKASRHSLKAARRGEWSVIVRNGRLPALATCENRTRARGGPANHRLGPHKPVESNGWIQHLDDKILIIMNNDSIESLWRNHRHVGPKTSVTGLSQSRGFAHAPCVAQRRV